ncbi:hypothetical protein MKW92_036964 [Papaver armeniacum]|nr:hypothetical protein MKW92_036964 [Papaver armeniacum]
MKREYSYDNEHLRSPSSPSSSAEPDLYQYRSSGSNQNSIVANTTALSLSAPPQLVSHKKKAGRKKFKETRHPVYRGVRQRRNDKWVCEVREPNSKSRIWLGTYPTPEMAARAYDVAALALRGESAPLNFQDSLFILGRAKSLSVEDIQSAAFEAAQNFPLPANSRLSSKNSGRVENAGKIVGSSSKATFLDEEALFNTPSLIASMAEGMLLDPPQEDHYYDDNLECSVDSLWSD